jgi:uncharacterized membrane protein YeiH
VINVIFEVFLAAAVGVLAVFGGVVTQLLTTTTPLLLAQRDQRYFFSLSLEFCCKPLVPAFRT